MLERALDAYERCLRQEVNDPELAANARFNLEVAKALLLRAKAQRSQNPERRGGEVASSSQGAKAGSRGEDVDPTSGEQRTETRVGMRRGSEGVGEAVPTEQLPPPGQGNLPPIPDRDQTVSMSPEDTAAYIRLVAERIARERREHMQRSAGVSVPGLKDW